MDLTDRMYSSREAFVNTWHEVYSRYALGLVELAVYLGMYKVEFEWWLNLVFIGWTLVLVWYFNYCEIVGGI